MGMARRLGKGARFEPEALARASRNASILGLLAGLQEALGSEEHTSRRTLAGSGQHSMVWKP